MGALRTSEEGGEVVGGEARQAKSDDNRAIDAPGQIIIDSTPVIATLPAGAPRAVPPPMRHPGPIAPQRAGGLGVVILVYILAAGALAAAIYERFIA